jgi:hypothetical protein
MVLFEDLLVDWACPPTTVLHRHAWSSVYICGCSICKAVLIHRMNLKFPFSFNRYAPMHDQVTYRQTPLYVWALDQALASSCPWWQSSSHGTLIESHWTCIFYANVGLSSLNPIFISLIRNLVEFPLERALPMSFGGIVHSCTIHWKLTALHHRTSLHHAMCIVTAS